METDTNGDIVYTSLTDIQGNSIQREERTDSTLQNKLYTGHKYDNVTNLTYAHARYLDTRSHTFLSVDPMYYDIPSVYLTDPQQMNSYGYARNNPVTNTDPTGLAKVTGAIATFNQAMVNAPRNMSTSASIAYATQVNAIMTAMYGWSSGSVVYGGGSSAVSTSGASSGGTVYTQNTGISHSTGNSTADLGLSLTPIAGNIISAYGALTGYDYATGEELSSGNRSFEAFAAIPVLGSVGKISKVALKGGKYTAKEIGILTAEHSFNKHVIKQKEFGSLIENKSQLAEYVTGVIQSSKTYKELSNGRYAWWDDRLSGVTIFNTKLLDKSSVFRPREGFKYFEDLK